MSYTDEKNVEPSLVPWLTAALVLSCICVFAAFSVTHSAILAALSGIIIMACMSLGWWAASWANGVAVEKNTIATEVVGDRAELATKISSPDRFAKSAIEATPNPVIIINAAGLIVTTNHAARTRFSIGFDAPRFNSVIRRPDIIEAVEAVLIDHMPRTLAIETRVPVDRYERLSVASFEAGEAHYVLVAVLDETEARMSERMRADFLANASHELRTPLAAIIGFIETLRGPARNDTKAREKFLEVMHLQADRMSRLISDLLSLSRIELNERVPPTEHTDVAAAAYEALDILTPDKKSRLVLSVEREPIWTLGNRDEMAQVMLNLIDNALKYSSPQSKVLVSIVGDQPREAAIATGMRQWENAARLPLTSPEVDRNRLYCVIRVENKGDGIDRKFLPRLSERFFRVEDSASGKSGTGLGLAIVKHIVSRHRGGLLVESELGRGSAFAVYLPQPFHVAQPPDLRLSAQAIAVTEVS